MVCIEHFIYFLCFFFVLLENRYFSSILMSPAVCLLFTCIQKFSERDYILLFIYASTVHRKQPDAKVNQSVFTIHEFVMDAEVSSYQLLVYKTLCQ